MIIKLETDDGRVIKEYTPKETKILTLAILKIHEVYAAREVQQQNMIDDLTKKIMDNI